MTGMELGRLVEGVRAVRATSKKTEKTQLFADLLRQAQGRDTNSWRSTSSGRYHREGSV